MSPERVAIIVIGVLALVFGIALFEKLGQPMPSMGGRDDGGIASFIYLALIGSMLAYFVFRGRADKASLVQNLIIWGVIIACVVLLIQSFGGSGPAL